VVNQGQTMYAHPFSTYQVLWTHGIQHHHSLLMGHPYKEGDLRVLPRKSLPPTVLVAATLAAEQNHLHRRGKYEGGVGFSAQELADGSARRDVDALAAMSCPAD
jgi:hypothetical protein